ncbi:hypothetical protein SADUNF_Sadunf13G0108800 [Salix dunnii]|uniref:Uncharacterized protein n=1 Tax=Salix dunnii TaxID=1413687 RepID=A0A835MV82_9ROSI|nr:hypothetical protein SADUNF_Sadunf13G0108800 [Salix dunnii]
MDGPSSGGISRVVNGVIEELPPFPRRSGLEMLAEVSKFTEGHTNKGLVIEFCDWGDQGVDAKGQERPPHPP